VECHWATVCETVRPMLSDRCDCNVVTVTLVYYGQTVAWIKMSLGMEVGLAPGHIVLDGAQLPRAPKGAHQPPHFSHMSVVGKRSPISLVARRWRVTSIITPAGDRPMKVFGKNFFGLLKVVISLYKQNAKPKQKTHRRTKPKPKQTLNFKAVVPC